MKQTGDQDMREAVKAFSLERFATGTRADFRFAPLNALVLVALFVIGPVAHLTVYGFHAHAAYLTLASALVLAFVIRIT